MADASYLTPEGFEKLKSELHTLKTTEREDLAKRLRSAIQMGDLSENADYHKAKEDQAFLEGRINELEYILKNVVIIDRNNIGISKVSIGSKITVREDDLEEETWFLVGPKEANPRDGKISHESPIGKALIDRKAGDIVHVDTPGGDIRIHILKLE
ncbi:MAG: transcription elongation factor GreA [Anaerolinea sp.]|nr:transcription elongation factor GreA [Anaerolinea sp.]